MGNSPDKDAKGATPADPPAPPTSRRAPAQAAPAHAPATAAAAGAQGGGTTAAGTAGTAGTAPGRAPGRAPTAPTAASVASGGSGGGGVADFGSSRRVAPPRWSGDGDGYLQFMRREDGAVASFFRRAAGGGGAQHGAVPVRLLRDEATRDAHGGGGVSPWVLTLAYWRQGGDRPPVEGRIPSSMHDYCHVSGRTLGGWLGLEEVVPEQVTAVRFYAATSRHERRIHFASSNKAAIALALGRSDGLTTGPIDWNDGLTLLEGHTAKLPQAADTVADAKRTLLSNPFASVAAHARWQIGVGGKFLVDDGADAGSTAEDHSIHLVWVKFGGMFANPERPDKVLTESPARWAEDLARLRRPGGWNGAMVTSMKAIDGSRTMPVVVDVDHEGHPWLLVFCYSHKGGENKALCPGRLPDNLLGYSHIDLRDVGGHLGRDFTEDEIASVKFYAHTSAHSRIIHFDTSSRNVARVVLTGDATGNEREWWIGARPHPGHSAMLPASCQNRIRGSGLWRYPISDATHSWNVRGEGNKWCVDDDVKQEHSTLHQIWIKFRDSVVTFEDVVAPAPEYSRETVRLPPAGTLGVVKQPSLTEATVTSMSRPDRVAYELQAMLLNERPGETMCFLCEGTGQRWKAVQNVYGKGVESDSSAGGGAADEESKDTDVPAASDTWVCHMCTWENSNVLSWCETCETPRKVDAASIVTDVARKVARMKQKVREHCWACNGTGKTTQMLGELEVKEEEADEDDVCPICFTDPPQYGISTECVHFFCEDCIRSHITEVLRNGTAPAFCPGCTADAPTGQTPAAGRIEGKAMTFLERKGVIDKETQFRFMRLQREAETLFFLCPAKCGNALVDVDPEVVLTGDTLSVKVERCPCGVGVCVSCHQQVPDAEFKTHVCPDGARVDFESDRAALAVMASIGKKCPRCGQYVVKNGGCDYMMCGTTAHGRLRDAIQNGGCGECFSWATGRTTPTFFTNLQGKQVNGNPPEMYASEIRKLRHQFGFGKR